MTSLKDQHAASIHNTIATETSFRDRNRNINCQLAATTVEKATSLMHATTFAASIANACTVTVTKTYSNPRNSKKKRIVT